MANPPASNTPVHLPRGWRITGTAALGEGVEATGPDGARVITAWEEELPKAIRDRPRG